MVLYFPFLPLLLLNQFSILIHTPLPLSPQTHLSHIQAKLLREKRFYTKKSKAALFHVQHKIKYQNINNKDTCCAM